MNREQLNILRTEIIKPDYNGMSYETIASTLNAQSSSTISNPEPQEYTPKKLKITHVLNTIKTYDSTGMKNMLESLSAGVIALAGECIEKEDFESLSGHIDLASMYISAEAVSGVWDLIYNPPTELDPSYQSEITIYNPSIADNLGLPRVTTEDIQSVFHLEAV